MAANRQSTLLSEPEPVRALDIFPELSKEIDSAIAHSEQRIKFWVMAGIVTNLMVAVGAAIPLVFTMGQISRDISTATSTQQAQAIELSARGKWMQDRMVWEARMESRMQAEQRTQPEGRDR